jgi:hypothetical protein
MASLFRGLAVVLLLAVLAWLPTPGAACPFCTPQGTSLLGETAQATMVLYGDLTDARQDPDTGEGTTKLTVAGVVKGNKAYEGQKEVTLSRFIPVFKDAEGKYFYLVFCDVFKGKVDPYRVLPVQKGGDVAQYLKGALALKDEKIARRLRFFFDYLDNSDLEVSNDAYREFANADYKDYRDMAKDLPADRIAGWLEEPEKNKTPAYRYGLYASMLGHCGTEKHAALLHKLLEDPARRVGSGVDGILAAYVMLKPKEGWAYLDEVLKDAKKEFLLRYAGLRAVRFLWDSRPDLVARNDLKEGVAQLLDQGDIADLAIDDLRKWACWDLAARVLALKDKPVYEVPIVRRAILRFALCCKGNAACERYVADQRAKDPQMVSDVEELLKLEQMPPPPVPAAGK